MKLKPVHLVVPMAYRHDLAGRVLPDDAQFFWERLPIGGQGMIPGGLHHGTKAPENRLVGTDGHLALLAVHQLGRMDDLSPKGFTDGLVSQTHS